MNTLALSPVQSELWQPPRFPPLAGTWYVISVRDFAPNTNHIPTFHGVVDS